MKKESGVKKAKAKCVVRPTDPNNSIMAEGIQIFIGDQADPSFWTDFRRRVPRVDIFIDDGGHSVEQMLTTNNIKQRQFQLEIRVSGH